MTAYSAPVPRWSVILSTIALHLAALLAFLPAYFSWSAVAIALVLHCLTIGFGISLGFHRLAAHRSFKLPKWLEYSAIICGTLACQGGVKGWVGYHRLHHLHTDRSGDPHDSTRGFWWCHINWLMHEVPNSSELATHTKDIAKDPVYSFCHRYYLEMQVGLAVLLYGLGGMPFVVWGIFARLFIGFHATCFVNSVCHNFGYRSHANANRSTNCWWVALLTFGEGWHNNHHASPTSARFGWRWWEVDAVWLTIRLLGWLGLATRIKPARPAVASKLD